MPPFDITLTQQICNSWSSDLLQECEERFGEKGELVFLSIICKSSAKSNLFLWARGRARHAARIKVNRTHGRQMTIDDAVTVALRPIPRVIAGTLSSADRQAIFQWIAMNEAARERFSSDW
jgi:hypothetical protein